MNWKRGCLAKAAEHCHWQEKTSWWATFGIRKMAMASCMIRKYASRVLLQSCMEVYRAAAYGEWACSLSTLTQNVRKCC